MFLSPLVLKIQDRTGPESTIEAAARRVQWENHGRRLAGGARGDPRRGADAQQEGPGLASTRQRQASPREAFVAGAGVELFRKEERQDESTSVGGTV